MKMEIQNLINVFNFLFDDRIYVCLRGYTHNAIDDMEKRHFINFLAHAKFKTNFQLKMHNRPMLRIETANQSSFQ